MRKTILTLALAASAIGAAAGAQTTPPAPPPPGMMPQGGMGPRGGGMGALMRADTNHDGIVTRAEAIAEADQRFDRMDANHDGVITADEMAAYRNAMRERMEARGGDVPVPPPGGPKRAPGMGRKMDPDGSGTITRAEFEARAGQRFDRMDANHDGKLDKTELANMAELRHVRRDERQAGDMPPPPPPQQ